MDGSNDGPGSAGPKEMSRAGYARNMRAVLDERHQRVIANRHHLEPQVHEQISRLFQDYEAPFYARLRGFGRTQTMALAESTVLSLAAVNGRALEDPETQALTEHFLSSVHNLLAWKWAMTGLAGYMTYRGRKTWRFPFFKPEFKRFSPIGGPPAVKFLWHSARFAAYYTALWVFGEPLFQGANFMRQRAAMERDPRIRSLLHEGKAQGATLLGAGAGSAGGIGGNGDASPEVHNHIRDAWEAAAQEESYRSSQPPPPPPPQQQQQQQASRSWDDSDDVDDASPVAPSNQSSNYQGSAWDRIRQQSQYQPERQRRDHQSWERPQSGGNWSSDVDANRQPQAYSDNSSYSSATEEKSLAKEQAQREFDRLLERERGNADQDRAWSKR